jgi:flagellar biosynthesis component FlhA
VSVIDETGKLLADGAAQSDPQEGAGADERKATYEKRLREQVEAIVSSVVGQGDERTLAMQPSKLSEFITLVREKFEEAAREGEAPVLVTSAGIRPFVRGIVERFRAQTPVVSQGEIHPRARLKTVASI